MSNTEIWLTVKQVVNLMDIPKRTIINRINKVGFYNPAPRKETIKGGEAYMIALSSLPPEVQLKYYKSHGSNLPAVIENKPEEIISESIELTEYQINIMTRRAFVVRKYIESVGTSTYGSKDEVKDMFMAGYKVKPEFQYCRDMLKEFSLGTLERWKKAYLDSGRKLESLAPGYNYKGSKNFVNISAEEEKIILENLLHPNAWKIAEVIRFSMKQFEALNLPYRRSEATYFRFIQWWINRNYDVYLGARYGQKMLNDKNAPSLDRNFDKIEVGDSLVIDGHDLNFTIINPLNGKAQRMVLIMVLDMKTWIPLGWEIMPTENTYSITSALRHAVKRLGFLPLSVYIDNGRANKSKHFLGDKKKKMQNDGRWFKGDLTEAVGILEGLGIKHVIARAYNGQSKVIERFFEIFAELERRVISYIGTSIQKKPARLMRNEKIHMKMWNDSWDEERRAGRTSCALELNEAMQFIAMWINEYVHRAHRSGKQKGLSPAEVLMASIEKVKAAPLFEERLISEDRLRLLMTSVKITKLYPNGIRLPKRGYYWNDELYKYDKRKDKVRFHVRYDILDFNLIYVYELETGRFICEAALRQSVHPLAAITGTEEDRAEVSRQIGQKDRLKKQTFGEVKKVWNGIDPAMPDGESSKKLIALHASDKAKKKNKSEEPAPRIRRGDLCLDVEEPVKTEEIKPDYSINEAV